MGGDKMNKKLFKQVRNEWRSNLWILAEFLIVSVVMWLITDYIYVTAINYTSEKGFDISHCYLINVNKLTPNSHEYNPKDSLDNIDLQELLTRIQHRPEVEAASFSQSSYPYNGSNSTIDVAYKNFKFDTDNFILRRRVTPDFVKVFRYHGVNGESPERLAELLNKNEILLSDNLLNYNHIYSLKNFVGKEFKLNIDTTRTYRLGASIIPVRYDDFRSAKSSYCCLLKMDYKDLGFGIELCVRVKENMDNNFIENLWKDANKQLRVGNIYISDIKSFKDIRTTYQRNEMNEVRYYIVGGVFLMLNIFLGILGTFWFRTQQRKGEIALFKALGSTNKSVFNREIAEGLILLSLATLFAAIIDINLAYNGLNTNHDGATLEIARFIITVLVSYLLLAVMVVIGIWFPANRATKIQPAEALHEE
jgi:putative ABC transport system permease protein